MRGRHPLAVAARASVIPLVVGLGLISAPGLARSATKHAAPSTRQPFAYNTTGVVGIGADPGSVSGPAVLQFQGVTGASFNPTVVQPINLGQFVAVPSSLASGQSTTYNGTPFQVEVQTPEFNTSSNVPLLDQVFPALNKSLNLKSSVENSLLLKGHLNGTVSGNGQVNVVATVDSIKLGSMTPGSKDQVTHYTFPIRFSQFVLPPSWVMSGSTPSVTQPTSTANPIMTAALAPNPISSDSLTTGTTSASTSTGTVAPVPAAESVIVTRANPAAPLPTPAPEPSTIVLFATVLGGLALGRRRLRAV